MSNNNADIYDSSVSFIVFCDKVEIQLNLPRAYAQGLTCAVK